MQAARLATLSWDIDADGVVPVAQIENLAIACAGQLVERTSAKIGRVHRGAIAGASDGPAIENGLGRRCDATERMDKPNAMQFSPGPVLGIRAKLAPEALLTTLERLQQPSVRGGFRRLPGY